MASTRTAGTISVSGSEVGSPPRYGNQGRANGVRLLKKGARPSAEEFKPARLVKGGPGTRKLPGSGELLRPSPYDDRTTEASDMGSPQRGFASGGFDGYSVGGRTDFEGDDDGAEESATTRSRRSRSGRLKLSKRFSFYKQKVTAPDRLGLLMTGQDMEAAWGPAPVLGGDEKEDRWCTPRRCCCCCCCTLVVLILLLGVAAVTTYFIIKPRAPDYTIENVYLEYFAISDKYLLTSVANITIRSKNPNRVGIVYERVLFDTKYKEKSLGVAEGDKVVHQGPRSTVWLMAVLEIQQADVSDVQSDITADVTNGTMGLDIGGKVIVRVEYKGFKSPRFQVQVDCHILVSLDTVTRKGKGLLSKHCGVFHGVKFV